MYTKMGRLSYDKLHGIHECLFEIKRRWLGVEFSKVGDNMGNHAWNDLVRAYHSNETESLKTTKVLVPQPRKFFRVWVGAVIDRLPSLWILRNGFMKSQGFP